MNINTFIESIKPSQNEISDISTTWWYIRKTIMNKVDFIDNSFLSGSYIRHTKNSPIDDLDIIFHIDGSWCELEWNWAFRLIKINYRHYDNHHLMDYTSVYWWIPYISPTKILNEMKRKIQETYPKTENINRNWECITVNFSSYDLTVDCMPYFTVDWEQCLLIPAGSSIKPIWKTTYPNSDMNYLDEMNDSRHYNWKLKWTIRLFKYRNEKRSPFRLKSYLVECLVCHALENRELLYNSSYARLIKEVISFIKNCNISNVPDISYMTHLQSNFTYDQIYRLNSYLDRMEKELNEWEDNFISYLTR